MDMLTIYANDTEPPSPPVYELINTEIDNFDGELSKNREYEIILQDQLNTLENLVEKKEEKIILLEKQLQEESLKNQQLKNTFGKEFLKIFKNFVCYFNFKNTYLRFKNSFN